MSRLAGVILGVSLIVVSGVGAAVLYARAVADRETYALIEATEAGQPLDPANVRTVAVRTTEAGRLIPLSTVAGWVNDGYVAAHDIPAGAWLRAGDYIEEDPTPPGWARVRIDTVPPDGTRGGDRIRLFWESPLLGWAPFPCWPDVDTVVSVAQRTGIRDVGWRQDHLHLMGVPQPEDGGLYGWGYYRALVEAGRAGLAPDTGLWPDASGDARGTAVYSPRTHLVEHYGDLCGTTPFQLAEYGEDHVIVTVPTAYASYLMVASATGEFRALALPDEVAEGQELADPRGLRKTNLHAPLMARPIWQEEAAA